MTYVSGCVGAAMVEALSSKTRAWEEDRGTEFLYDGVGVSF